MIPWTEERIKEAATLWIAGLSTTEIGRRLGVSRNAISGLAFRTRDRFPPRSAVCRNGVARTAGSLDKTFRAPRRSPAAAEAVVKAPKVKPERQIVEPPRFVAADGQKYDLGRYRLSGMEAVPFMALSKGQCRFPLTAFDAGSGPDMPCCGAPSADEFGPYCSAHTAVAAGRLA